MKLQKVTQKNKTIALLAIGNELVEGQIQDSNSFHFSGIISAEGGTVRHQRQVTDSTQDIVDDVQDLLSKNEVLIITGGLGPTSDDKTRHAISEALDLPLAFDEPSWDHIKARLTQFGLAIAPSNRQQALFPQGATILDNEQGSARGAHINHKGCDLFMLPGPPNECWPMFDAYVLPFLKHHDFFKAHHTLRFLTLGLVEGEIAPCIDDIAEPFQAKTGYRWTYPYIEIKLKVEQPDHIEPLRALILEQIKDHLVSSNDDDAFAILKHNLLEETSPTLTIQGPEAIENLIKKLNHPKLHYQQHTTTEGLCLQFETVKPNDPSKEIMKIHSHVFLEGRLIYSHTQTTPYRSTRIHLYIEHYCAWQISRVIRPSP